MGLRNRVRGSCDRQPQLAAGPSARNPSNHSQHVTGHQGLLPCEQPASSPEIKAVPPPTSSGPQATMEQAVEDLAVANRAADWIVDWTVEN